MTVNKKSDEANEKAKEKNTTFKEKQWTDSAMAQMLRLSSGKF